MPVYNIEVGSLFLGMEAATVVGAADVQTALADASDSTYAYLNLGKGVGTTAHLLSTPSSPTGRLASIGLYVRASNNLSTDFYAAVWACGNPLYYVGPLAVVAVCDSVAISPSGGAAGDYEVLACQGVDPGALIAAGAIPPDLLAVALTSLDSNALRFIKVQGRLYYLPAATVTGVSAPSGTVTTTQKPTLTAALSLTVESWQLPSFLPTFLCGGDVEYQVFLAADAPGAAPPVGVLPVADVFARFSETTVGARTPSISATSSVGLPNGTYVLFARVSRDLQSGPQLYWSSWVKSSSWVQNVPVPATPTVTLAADATNQRVSITANAATTSGYDSALATVEVQRQVTGGWRAVRLISGLPLTLGSAQLVGYDYESDRGVSNTYRARVVQWHTADAVYRSGAWSTSATVTGPALTGSGWNLKTVELPASNWIGAGVLTAPAQESQGSVGVLQVLDRELPVTVGGTTGGMADSFDVVASGSTEIAALKALRDYNGLVLIESAFGDVKYARLLTVSWARRGTAAAPRLQGAVKFAEVGSGLEVVAS